MKFRCGEEARAQGIKEKTLLAWDLEQTSLGRKLSSDAVPQGLQTSRF